MPSLRRGLVAAAVVSGVVWAVVVAAWGEGPFTLTFDDAWYYAGIARNVAAGHGSTFDGINPTNGYHPLWLGVCVVAYRVGLDDEAAVRALLLVQVACWAAALVLLAGVIDRAAGPLGRAGRGVVTSVFGLVALSPFVVKTFVNGLETGVAVAIHAGILAVGSRPSLSRRAAAGLGALVALAFLARTDAALLAGTLGLWLVVRRRAVADAALVAGPPAIVAVLYLAANRWAFGSPWQVSGAIKRAPLDAGSVGPFLVVAALAGALLLRPPRADGAVRFPRAGGFAAATAWYGVAAALIVAYYQFLQTQQWLWYYAPAVLWLAVLFVLAVADVVSVAGTDRRVVAVGGLVFVLPLAVGCMVQLTGFTDPAVRSIQLANRDAGRWIDADLPAGARLASWDAGVVGYFARRPVVNLDGVVNSHRWAGALEDGTAGSLLRCQGVGWVVNHGAGAGGDDTEIVGLVERVWGGPAEVVHRVPFRYSGTANAGGVEVGPGVRDYEVRVYRVDPARVGPRAGDRCP